MRLFFLIIAFFLLLSGCSGSPRAVEGGNGRLSEAETGARDGEREGMIRGDEMMWNTLPHNSHLVFFAASNRLMDREEETEAALENASEQAAKCFGLIGEARFLKQRKAGGIGYLQDIRVEYDERSAHALLDDLDITSEYRDNRNTYIRAELPLTAPIENTYTLEKDDNGRPLWIDTPPAISGYLVGVGVAQRKRAFIDSINAADEKALEELLKQVSTTIRTIHSRHTIENVGTIHDTTSLETAKAHLTGFYVLSRYREGNYYYTLAVARKRQND